jgi:hypothetical protein
MPFKQAATIHAPPGAHGQHTRRQSRCRPDQRARMHAAHPPLTCRCMASIGMCRPPTRYSLTRPSTSTPFSLAPSSGPPRPSPRRAAMVVATPAAAAAVGPAGSSSAWSTPGTPPSPSGAAPAAGGATPLAPAAAGAAVEREGGAAPLAGGRSASIGSSARGRPLPDVADCSPCAVPAAAANGSPMPPSSNSNACRRETMHACMNESHLDCMLAAWSMLMQSALSPCDRFQA